MRKILFRGFHPSESGATTITIDGRKVKGEWVYGDLIHRQIWASALTVIRESDDGFENYEEYEVIPETVGQWVTSIFDGVDIFEGDIIGVHQFLFDGTEHERELIGRVVWDDACVCWAVDKIEHSEIQEYMGYDNISRFAKEKVAICMLYGLHEESYRLIGNQWEDKQ